MLLIGALSGLNSGGGETVCGAQGNGVSDLLAFSLVTANELLRGASVEGALGRCAADVKRKLGDNVIIRLYFSV